MAKKNIDVWTENFAKNERVRDAITRAILPLVRNVREARDELEREWMRYYNMWNVTHDEFHNYSGRAKLYIPEVRKNVEAQARQLTEAMFPNDDYLNVSPGEGGTRRGALIHKSIRLWQIEQAQLRMKMHVFNRQECLYGTSPAYVCWNKKVETAFKHKRNKKTGKIELSRDLVELFNGPDFMVRDLFKWYALNPKNPDVYEGGTVEFNPLDAFELRRREKAGYLYGIDDLLKGPSDAYLKEELEKELARAESLGITIEQNRGYAGAISLAEDRDEIKGTHLCATVYAKIACPEACLEGEDPELPIPFKIEIYNGEHVGFAGRNPFFHQRPPYVVGKYILPNADEFYGQGIPKAIQYMQYEMNSKAEQAMDSATYALNPIAFIDPAYASQNGNFELEPGAKWWISPAGVKFGSLPDLSQTGYAAVQSLKTQMADYSDRAPALPPQLAGKSRTATQSEIIDRAVSVDNKTFQLQNEIMVLQPLMEMWEFLTDQNIEEDQVIMILGRRSADWKRSLISKNQMLGNYRYFWKGAGDLGNKQVTGRQILDMMKVIGSLPPEAQAKLKTDFAEIVKVLWTDFFNLPDSERVFGREDEPLSQDPEVVWKMLERGMEVEVLPADNDEVFISFLSKKAEGVKDKWLLGEIARQVALHKVQLEKKQLQQKQMIEAMRQQLAQQQLQAQGQLPAPKAPTNGPNGSGNRTQLSPNANAGSMGSGMRA